MGAIFKIDKTDKEILKMLVKNGKASYMEMAKALGVSHGTIHQRVKKLERRGIIKKTSIVVDYEILGFGFICFIGIYSTNGSDLSFICKELKKIPQITVAHITTGQFNLFCKLRARNSKDAQRLIEKIHSIRGVARTESMVSFEEFINSKDQLVGEIL